MKKKDFRIAKKAFEEIESKLPTCGKWLKESNLECIPLSNDIFIKANLIKTLLGIDNDQYNKTGVGENDILIIATAKVYQLPLISEEADQTILPKNPSNYKIPAVCKLENIEVTCHKFIHVIKSSNKVFN